MVLGLNCFDCSTRGGIREQGYARPWSGVEGVDMRTGSVRKVLLVLGQAPSEVS